MAASKEDNFLRKTSRDEIHDRSAPAVTPEVVRQFSITSFDKSKLRRVTPPEERLGQSGARSSRSSLPSSTSDMLQSHPESDCGVSRLPASSGRQRLISVTPPPLDELQQQSAAALEDVESLDGGTPIDEKSSLLDGNDIDATHVSGPSPSKSSTDAFLSAQADLEPPPL